MSLYHLLKVSNVDLPRVHAMRASNDLGRGVLIDVMPFSNHYSIVACPMDSDAAAKIRGEVASETLDLATLRSLHP